MSAIETGIPGYETTQQAAERLSISDAHIRRLCGISRRWPGARKVGRQWFVPEDSKPEVTGFGRPPTWAKED